MPIGEYLVVLHGGEVRIWLLLALLGRYTVPKVDCLRNGFVEIGGVRNAGRYADRLKDYFEYLLVEVEQALVPLLEKRHEVVDVVVVEGRVLVGRLDRFEVYLLPGFVVVDLHLGDGHPFAMPLYHGHGERHGAVSRKDVAAVTVALLEVALVRFDGYACGYDFADVMYGRKVGGG